MSLTPRLRQLCVFCCLAVAGPAWVSAQSGYAPEAGEYAVAGALAGEQTFPDLALNGSGGFIVWQDNITDGSGLGISARQLNGTFSGSLGNFRVNQSGADDQENARVSLLNGGGAAFVWQGGKQGFQRIYARFLGANGTWLTGDVRANSFTNDYQLNPGVTTLANGDVVVVWSSRNQESAASMQGVFAQRFSATGQKLGGEFQINEFTSNNQRTPVVAGLKDGRFAVAWVSEQQQFENSVDIYARLFSAAGVPSGGEFVVNTSTNVCANPSVVAAGDGGFAVAWSEKDLLSVQVNSWDAVARTFSATGFGGAARRVNTQTAGDQYAPKISAAGSDYLVAWISMAQDGSYEGIYGQFLHSDGSLAGGELRINTTTAGPQLYPAVGSDGAGRFLVTWTSFGPGVNSFDLFAQRFASTTQPLLAPTSPFVSALDQSRLQVAWPGMDGFAVANYEVYADGASSATAVVTNNLWRMTGLTAGSTHTFRLAYVLTDGRRSPLSASSTGTTWGADDNFDGLPDDWQVLYWGSNPANWPSPTADSDGDGASNRDEFLAGTNPTNAASVLRIKLSASSQGMFLTWNTQPGQVYQVQGAESLGAWANLGLPRFANGGTDSLNVGGSQTGYYRVLRVR